MTMDGRVKMMRRKTAETIETATGAGARRARPPAWTPLALATLLAAGCEEATGPADMCDLQPLPFQQEEGGPSVVDAILYVEGQTDISVALTVTHPEGDAALLEIVQTVGVFPDSQCAGEPLEISDDLAGSGLEESFGVVVTSDVQAGVYDAIEGANRWPVEVTVSDTEGRTLTGRVEARVRR